MYAKFWGVLPGSTPIKALICVVLFALLVVLLFLVVFPIVDAMLPIDESEISTAPAGLQMHSSA